ncbi:DHA2 family efflux MFS transporter permease subunit [Frankia sp. CNm7]|uniref:DHA2 family efflux MFS transporter permease subunit n=1 Tax=Frankia nepalensis TaxID=1836974 RepID=A0A937RC98_9ACTN|nr:MDR family MFS transporter [Frankia nepalensis]MBL7496313.1 DHA2 family efflux MFS transporter permease subunit [Frankia nepalensis]MBL7508490.1 DHA2 family efflux MFS transporter permease subunit [Frankia nepalensis]MBL7519525.1 DHA2 family efflux MFS transporter permease subunit [Frankia nepalensis]MBL7627622.1 DHA2 family efflux MFS transporter permease subunit [Frankia nepalensis]
MSSPPSETPAASAPAGTGIATSAKDEKLDPAVIRLALVILVGAVAVQLDATITSVAIETLGRTFDVGVSTIQWVTTAYLLALAMVIPLTGWSVERFGGKRMWIVSLVLFLAGSVLCGLAWSAESLIAFRVVQGLGGGLLLPLMQTLLAQAAGPAQLPKLIAAISVPSILTPVLGPILGGVIVDSVSWRWIFLINIPVCLIAIFLAIRVLPDPRGSERHPLDILGLALLSPGLAIAVYGFSEAGSEGSFDNARVLVPLLIGLALLAAFTVHALRARIEPIIDLRLLRNPAFLGSTGLMFLFGMSLFGAMFLTPIYEQVARGRSATEAGLLLAPQGLGMGIGLIVFAPRANRLSARGMVIAGLVLTVLGSVAYTQAGHTPSEWLLGSSLAVRGLGMAITMIPTMTATYHGLRHDQIPRATTTSRILQQIGGSLGTAVLAVVLATEIRERAGSAGSAGAPVTAESVAAAGGPVPNWLAEAFGTTFWWPVIFTLISIPAAFLIPRRLASAEQGPGASAASPAPGPSDPDPARAGLAADPLAPTPRPTAEPTLAADDREARRDPPAVVLD